MNAIAPVTPRGVAGAYAHDANTTHTLSIENDTPHKP
jgi:hypothetical protein